MAHITFHLTMCDLSFRVTGKIFQDHPRSIHCKREQLKLFQLLFYNSRRILGLFRVIHGKFIG